jgi:hypothetical protein
MNERLAHAVDQGGFIVFGLSIGVVLMACVVMLKEWIEKREQPEDKPAKGGSSNLIAMLALFVSLASSVFSFMQWDTNRANLQLQSSLNQRRVTVEPWVSPADPNVLLVKVINQGAPVVLESVCFNLPVKAGSTYTRTLEPVAWSKQLPRKLDRNESISFQIDTKGAKVMERLDRLQVDSVVVVLATGEPFRSDSKIVLDFLGSIRDE